MSCEDISQRDYAALGAALEGQQKLFRAMLEITHYCNNRCIHCYIEPDRDDLAPDPPAEVLVEIMDALVAEQTLWLSFTGGEPLLRPDFPQLYMEAKRRGFLISIFTNARLITDEIARMLRDYPPRLLSISLYGATASTYDRVAAVSGAFDEAMAGIRRIADLGVRFHLKSILMRANFHEMHAMEQIANDFGVSFTIDTGLTPTLYSKCTVLEQRLTPEEIVAMEQSDERKAAIWRENIQVRSELRPDGRHYHCGAGNTLIVIGPDLTARLCVMCYEPRWPLDVNDIRGSLHKIFFENFREERQRRLPPDCKCANCDMVGLCPTCAPWREQEVGSAALPCEFGCKLTALRLAAFGKKKLI